ncbi:zinc finger protein [Crotalus adamanteus]|uniref:Zinc finger protein n=1 Tax=Crotalus adamanteus TaxID=8729 RepID=A0AAW1BVX8_CROAD
MMENQWLVVDPKQKPYKETHQETCETLVALTGSSSSKPSEIFLVKEEKESSILEPGNRENPRRANLGEGMGSEEEEESEEEEISQQHQSELLKLDARVVSRNCKSLRWRVVQPSSSSKVLAGEGPPILVLQKGYECEDCGKCMHVEERLYPCPQCKQHFCGTSHLYRHLRSHAQQTEETVLGLASPQYEEVEPC